MNILLYMLTPLMLITAPIQYFLSKQRNPYLGLILPVIILYKPLSPFFLLGFSPNSGLDLRLRLYFLVAGSTPVLVLLLIYYLVRKKMNRGTTCKEIKKMEIEDL